MHPNGMLTPVLAGLTLSSLAVWIMHSEGEALKSIADAERAFSKQCGKVGFRQSFLDNFAADGVFYAPMPKNAIDDLKKQPEEPKPKFPPFEWAPIAADVSVAGDLGYTTGPLRFWSEDGSKVVGWGYYFSVWRRQEKGQWKVVADLGMGSGGVDLGDPGQAKFKAAPDFRTGRKAFSEPKARTEASLLKAEEEFGLKAASVPFAEAILASGTSHVRVHRNGFVPAVAKAEVKKVLGALGPTKLWKPLGCGVAKSGDFGYTIGQYETETQEGKVRKGYWVRVWKRESNQWRLVADVANEERPSP